VLVRDLKSKRVADRAKAADGLGPLAEKAGLASRALCETLLDTPPQVRLAAEHALEKVNPAIHRLVVPIVVDKDLRERVPAIQRVGALGEEGNPAVPVLVYFKMNQRIGGQVAVEALAQVDQDKKSLVKLRVGWLLRDPLRLVRAAAAKALGQMRFGRDAFSALIAAVKSDRDDDTLAAAGNALACRLQGKL
jgi:hypothetical protein